MKQRLDKELVARGLVATRSQAENYIRLGDVVVGGRPATKPGLMIDPDTEIILKARQRYVSRAGLKLAGAATELRLNFTGKVVLDVGSSTGGFTDYSLQNGAKLVYAVDVGTDQLHPSLRSNPRVELHEKTDIRDFVPDQTPDIVVIDVSFISVRHILEHLAEISGVQTEVLVMVKPQFEADRKHLNGSGVVKNNNLRRQILQDFENWVRQFFLIINKRDSEVAGSKGNVERFYLLKPIKKAKH